MISFRSARIRAGILVSAFLAFAGSSLWAELPELDRIELSVAEIVMSPGDRQELSVTVQTVEGEMLALDELPQGELRLVSLNPEVAAVGSAGQIYARGFGAATIRAEISSGGRVLTEQVRIGVPERLLAESDFVLDGPYGSYGSKVEQVGSNHFRFLRGRHPEESKRMSLPQFIIPANFRGNNLVLDIEGLGIPSPGHNYFVAYSFDGEDWTPVLQEQAGEKTTRVQLPPGDSDTLYFGFQIPLSHDSAERWMRQWASAAETSRFVTIHDIGRSIEDRPLYRMEVTDPESPHAREDRWVHYISQAHPHEGKARWRLKGMIDWLLSEEGRDARQRHIWNFVLTMNPDGVNNGFTRVNMEGVDMNRTYRVAGSMRSEQAHEAFLYQRDIEQLMASETPLTTFWDMHVWPNRVEPLILPGPEFGSEKHQLGPWTNLRQFIEARDDKDLVKPLALRDYEGNATMWDRGVHRQFGITASIVEGGGTLDTPEENLEAGAILIQGINEFYRGTKSRHPVGAR